ncbi:guanylate cyclase soluble subunit alpha-2-like [Centruroides vittatus]|uniref:guanylate cyclase soluble subunit alpha-2-like n=1 Tax=Centruroides vittatus TaxID=120091 RepID=UPI00350FEA90
MGVGCPFACIDKRFDTITVLSNPRFERRITCRDSVQTTKKNEDLTLHSINSAICMLFCPPHPALLAALQKSVKKNKMAKNKDAWGIILNKVDIQPPMDLIVKTMDNWTKNMNMNFEGTVLEIVEKTIIEIINVGVQLTGIEEMNLLEDVGYNIFHFCSNIYLKSLKFLGVNLNDFLVNVESLQEVLKKKDLSHNMESIIQFSVKTHAQGHYVHYQSTRSYMGPIIVGILKKIALELYNLITVINVIKKNKDYYIFDLKYNNAQSSYQEILSKNPTDLRVPVATFYRTFPFYFIIDNSLDVIQIGRGLVKLLSLQDVKEKIKFSSILEIVSPKITPSFKNIINKINTTFIIALKDKIQYDKNKRLSIKGQMIYCVESNTILFLGSPVVKSLKTMTGRGLHMSDIPIHDATRDILLVEEQSRAQDGLKKRMDKLKTSIQEASEAVAEERKKNVDLLYLIFPAQIAKKLWLGEAVASQQFDEVTLLFSDIVGFTSICSSATPMDVITMLNELYTQFDVFCEELDVYKTETIGDAYCVVGGLHRTSETHAIQTAWMALMMMETAQKSKSHDGKPIQMRIGLHTGTVLAGVVGVKMPRYCLFGHNVTMANKFESESEALRINISPTTHRILNAAEGFTFTERPKECLPKGFTEDGTCYFLDNFKHPEINGSLGVLEHIRVAFKALNLSSFQQT